jgi:dTDP-4-amino-4,6-dideoxygalactose transaminase
MTDRSGRVSALDPSSEHEAILDALVGAAERVIRSGRYVLGPEVDALEREISAHLGVAFAIGVSSGTDALLVALMALDVGPGDEVVTTPFTFFATGGCIARLGAKPVFVDIDPDTFNIDLDAADRAITSRTKAVVPVHLFGQPVDVAEVRARWAARHVAIVEDAAQAIGATTAEGPVGALGALGAFSFFPSKNLGGFGDGGLVTTSDSGLAERVRILRAHGSKPKYFHSIVGGNFRLDELQAALLRVKLPRLSDATAARKRIAARYDHAFASAGLPPGRLRPPHRKANGHVYNQYVIRADRRDDLAKHLATRGIDAAIYYPLALHRQACFASLGYEEGSLPEAERACREVLALPIQPMLTDSQIDRVVAEVVSFLR